MKDIPKDVESSNRERVAEEISADEVDSVRHAVALDCLGSGLLDRGKIEDRGAETRPPLAECDHETSGPASDINSSVKSREIKVVASRETGRIAQLEHRVLKLAQGPLGAIQRVEGTGLSDPGHFIPLRALLSQRIPEVLPKGIQTAVEEREQSAYVPRFILEQAAARNVSQFEREALPSDHLQAAATDQQPFERSWLDASRLRQPLEG